MNNSLSQFIPDNCYFTQCTKRVLTCFHMFAHFSISSLSTIPVRSIPRSTYFDKRLDSVDIFWFDFHEDSFVKRNIPPRSFIGDFFTLGISKKIHELVKMICARERITWHVMSHFASCAVIRSCRINTM